MFVESQQKYHLIEMGQNYPFGQLRESNMQNSKILVHKKLYFQSKEQLNILTKMSQHLQSINNQYLIKLHHTNSNKDGSFSLFYQYVPLTIGKWVLDIGDQMIQKLQLQMMNLATCFAHNGIKFTFNPKCIGLSSDIKVKYFLRDFTYDPENKLEGYKQTSQQIINFFNDFKYSSSEGQQFRQEVYNERKSADCGTVIGSVTTRQSWKSTKSSNSSKNTPMSKSNNYSEMIQNAKKKNQQIMAKLKGLKTFQK